MRKASRIVTNIGAMVGLILLSGACAFATEGGQVPASKGAASGEPQLSEQQGLQSETVTLAEFDNDIALCRLKMRDSCAIVQQLIEKPGADEAEQSSLALRDLRDARSQWELIRTKYGENRPAEYAADAKFAARLSEIAAAMEDMEQHLTGGRFKQSFAACGRGCALFVEMHEENGLVYALDRLFHLRKLAKTAITAGKNKGALITGQFLPDMLHHLDRIVLAPCPWPEDKERCKDYRASVSELSSTLNELAASIANKNSLEAEKILNGLIGTINKAYGKAL